MPLYNVGYHELTEGEAKSLHETPRASRTMPTPTSRAEETHTVQNETMQHKNKNQGKSINLFKMYGVLFQI